MLELLVAVLILCLIAYVAYTLLPHPVGLIVAVVVAVVLLLWLLDSAPHGHWG